jgi:sarcosine oxidase subunit beta
MSHFSLPVLIPKALTGNKTWEPQWPDAEPKAEYDVVIVGAGGHGLGAAYYLAKEHGVTRVAVIDKGWLGGGNTGRNTTIIRSNYLYDESARLYEHAVKLWQGLSQEQRVADVRAGEGLLSAAQRLTNRSLSRRRRSSGVAERRVTTPSPGAMRAAQAL